MMAGVDPPTTIVTPEGSYELCRRIGNGSFGAVFLGKDVANGEEVAVKIEPLSSNADSNLPNPQLFRESKVYRMLSKVKGFVPQHGFGGYPRMRYFGQHGDNNVMVLDLLGPSLEDLLERCGRKFSVNTVARLAVAMISALEHFHGQGFIHRDIKPDNFLVGRSDYRNDDEIFLLDFGLAISYWTGNNRRSRNHIPMTVKKRIIGTQRYMSLNCHLGVEPSRRDDMESLGYVLMYFLRGSLPWSGLKAETLSDKTVMIHQKKGSTSLDALCEGYPVEFHMYLDRCRSMLFDEKPDYLWLRGLFTTILHRNDAWSWNKSYDWVKSTNEPVA